jgi:hypothetical protein
MYRESRAMTLCRGNSGATWPSDSWSTGAREIWERSTSWARMLARIISIQRESSRGIAKRPKDSDLVIQILDSAAVGKCYE